MKDRTIPLSSKALPWAFTRNSLILLLALKGLDGFGLHSFGGAPAFATSYLQDSSLIILVYLLWTNSSNRWPVVRTGANIFFALLLLVLMTLFALYSPFLSDLRNFPVNLFAIEPGLVRFFFQNLVTTKRLFGISLWLGALVLVTLRRPELPQPGKRWVWGARTGLGLSLLSLGYQAINPLIYSVQEEARIRLVQSGVNDVVRLGPPDPRKGQANHPLDRAFRGFERIAPLYDKLVIFAMESIRFRDFCEPTDSIEALCPSAPGHWKIFDHYYTPNLDSFTSLLAMLNSVFIPFQAYVNEDRYAFINNRENLVRFLNANGFSTHFVTSFGPHQVRFTPDRNEWTSTYFNQDVRADPRFVSVTSNPVEWACEDLSALDPLIMRLEKHKQVFIFQEMVYGHSPEWARLTGIEPIDYYRRYFRKFFDLAGQRGLLDKTLVVICSDHGPREEALDPENYRVPLLLWAKGLKTSNDNRFLSHLDLKDLLLEHLAGGPTLSGHEEIWVVGHSGEYIYGQLKADSGFTFISNRTLRVKTNRSSDEVLRFNRSFQSYLHYFEGIRG